MAYLSVLKFMPRIALASIFVYFLVQRIDCWFYGFLRKKFNNKFFIARNICSVFSTQFLDTVLFSFLGLYAIAGSILNIIAMSFTIKIVVIFVSTPFLSLSKKISKKYKLFFSGAVFDDESFVEQQKSEQRNISK